MRLSDVRGERVFDVIADIIDPVVDIATCDEMQELLERRKPPKDMDARSYMLQRVRRVLPKLIRDQKWAFVRIMSSIDGVKPEEYMEGVTLQSLYADVMGLLTDDVFTDFLSSAVASRGD